jgi:membrane-associated protease RseP (regulator of RpoE activity)
VDGFAHSKSPAQLAGLRPGDVIVAINGHHFSLLTQETAYLRARADQRVVLTVNRNGRIFNTTTVLANGAKEILAGQKEPLYTKKTGFLGISFGAIKYDFVGAVQQAGIAFGSTAALSLSRLGEVVGNFSNYVHMLSSQKAADSTTAVRFVSPVGVVRLANTATQIGLSEVLYLLILINIFIGIFNLLPLLPFDGGHVAIALYEKARSLRGRQPYHADVNKLAPVVYVVIAVLAFYAVSSLFLDLRDIIS